MSHTKESTNQWFNQDSDENLMNTSTTGAIARDNKLSQINLKFQRTGIYCLEDLEAPLRTEKINNVYEKNTIEFNKLLTQMSNSVTQHQTANMYRSGISSLEEVEAPLRIGNIFPQNEPREKENFQKLLTQMNNVTFPQQQQQQHSVTLMQLFQNQQRQNQMHNEFPTFYPNVSSQQRHIQPNDSIQQLLQLGLRGKRNEYLKLPEAQALIFSISQGRVSISSIHEQINNLPINSNRRHILLAVIDYVNEISRKPNIVKSMFPKNLQPALTVQRNLANYQQSLHNFQSSNLIGPIAEEPIGGSHFNVSNNQQASDQQNTFGGMPKGVSKRIPSQRELQYHTQSIMHSALLNKKLEEQRIHFQNEQEMILQQQLAAQHSSGILSDHPEVQHRHQ